MRCWALVANLNRYRIFDQLKERPCSLDTWGVNYHIDEIEAGDSLYIWATNSVGKKDRGLIAKGVVVSPPEKERSYFPWEKEYNENLGMDFFRARLELEYTRVFLSSPITARHLIMNGLGDIKVIRGNSRRGVYELAKDEARAIDSMIDKTRIDWINRHDAC